MALWLAALLLPGPGLVLAQASPPDSVGVMPPLPESQPSTAQPPPGQPPPARAAPPQPPVAPPPPAWEEPPDDEPERHLSFKVAVGGTYRRLYSIPVTGLAATMQIGGTGERVAGYVCAHSLGGGTEHGLGLRAFQLGGVVEWLLPPLRSRLGIGGKVGVATMDRATSDSVLLAGSFTFRALGNVDLVRFDEAQAVYVEVDFEYDLNGLWGPTGLVGYRFW